MKSFATDSAFIAAFHTIAVAFLVRAGHFDEVNARFEVEMIINHIGMEKFVAAAGKGKFENDEYISMTRVGATVPLNRKQRVLIALTLNNAINHAAVEVGYH